MLVACPDCHRQYDVGALAPGERVRCFCGRALSVPEPRPRTVAMQHCASCGGKLASAERACPYCGAEPSLAERGLGDPCPECLARLSSGARFCSACGIAIRPESLIQGLASIACPRCGGRLYDCRSDERSFAQCSSCGGLWLDVASFERLLAEHPPAPSATSPGAPRVSSPGAPRASSPGAPRASSTGAPRASSTGAPRAEPAARTPEADVRYLACPVCGDLMNRKNFGTFSGVIVDWCRGHGFWFDERELERILAFAAAGGLEREKALHAERERLASLRRAHHAPLASAGLDPTLLGELPSRPWRTHTRSRNPLIELLTTLAHALLS